MPKNPAKYLATLGIHSLKDTPTTYNPWWKTKTFPLDTPEFKRDAFD